MRPGPDAASCPGQCQAGAPSSERHLQTQSATWDGLTRNNAGRTRVFIVVVVNDRRAVRGRYHERQEISESGRPEPSRLSLIFDRNNVVQLSCRLPT